MSYSVCQLSGVPIIDQAYLFPLINNKGIVTIEYFPISGEIDEYGKLCEPNIDLNYEFFYKKYGSLDAFYEKRNDNEYMLISKPIFDALLNDIKNEDKHKEFLSEIYDNMIETEEFQLTKTSKSELNTGSPLLLYSRERVVYWNFWRDNLTGYYVEEIWPLVKDFMLMYIIFKTFAGLFKYPHGNLGYSCVNFRPSLLLAKAILDEKERYKQIIGDGYNSETYSWFN